MQALKLRAYQLLNKFIRSDITEIRILDATLSRAPNNDVSDYQFRFFDADDVVRFSKTEGSELKPEIATLLNDERIMCFGIVKGEQLAGYFWGATGKVAAEHNSGGGKFQGIGLDMADDYAYLFKGFVMPEHRGKALNVWMMHYIAQAYREKGFRYILCTTDWTNYAFQRSSAKLGFKSLKLEGEFVVGSRYFYWLPKMQDYGLTLFGGSKPL